MSLSDTIYLEKFGNITIKISEDGLFQTISDSNTNCEFLITIRSLDSNLISHLLYHHCTVGYDLWTYERRLFLIKDFVIQELGLFDENLYPAYCEDADYIMRMLNTSTKKITSLNSNYFHGDGNKGDYYETGSQTKKTDDSLSEKLEISNELNIKYLTKKWGPGWRVCEPEKLPFINEQHSIKETQYDLKFVRSKHMGF
jgi:hypothetical protein